MSQSQSQGQSYPSPFRQTQSGDKNRPKSQPKSKAKPKVIHKVMDDDDDDEEEVEAEIKLGTQPKRKSQVSSKGKASQPGKKKPPLFDLDSDEDVPPEPTYDDTLDDDTPDATLRSSKGTTQSQDAKPKTRGTKRKAALEEGSDSDQGLTFGGFSKKAKRK
ncbi:hypothetical protein JB92DRAFT_2807793 [Gautieria morchelliformis]|nr:hypothetical protein JB92DRAFT_2807793 [Gautieria morchelliformis]